MPQLWPFIQQRSYDWAYRTTPQPRLAGRSLEWPRGRGLGGSSMLHAMAHMHGCRADFAAWAEATGTERWSWDGLEPFFDGLEEAGGGPLPVLHPTPELSSPLVGSYLAGWESLGVPRIPDHNRGEMLGATVNALTIRDGRRVTAADAWLEPASTRSNLTVRTGVLVHRLLIEKGRVRGAVYSSRSTGGALETVLADRVILASGSIATPLLLMRSGVGDPAVLAEAGVDPVVESPALGGNLHDHLLGAGNIYRTRRPVPPSRLQISEAMTYLRADDLGASEGRPDIVVGCAVAPSPSEVYAPGLELAPGDGFTLFFGVTNPRSRGTLRITGPEVDDAPLIDPNYLDEESDRELFRAAFERARSVGRSAALAEWGAEEVLPGPALTTSDDLDAFIARAAITHHHPVGTARMGKTDDAPVTPELAVRGLEGVHVVDASVFPSITAGPVHATVLALAASFAASLA
ncbi:GMC family oxidoreductase N-terminal domain-containing protein [Gryllotalpicola koreensis]|uniref:GMC family oxidoreductase N-terminal domain-containing protein n=2 Tax=Gryllotalpicola koreensis TaxID=993086 RepID=A0ABP7ZRN9_9MICO